MANGRVITGFSHPTVAKYDANGGQPAYSDGMRLARGVEVSLSIETTDDNVFYADNRVAEMDTGEFKSGKVTLTVDGLLEKAEQFIMGLPDPEEVAYGESKKVNVVKYGRTAKPPYVGIGFLVRYQSDGAESYVPVILTKTKFSAPAMEAKTQEEQKDYQTQKLEATLARDDSANQEWKWVVAEQTSEADALAALDGLLNVKAGDSK